MKIFYSDKLNTKGPRHSAGALPVSGAFESSELLLQVLRGHLGIAADMEILRTDKGKPYLQNCPEIHFSITHTQNYWLCAVADFPVGIDAEFLSRNVKKPEHLAERFFSEDEAVCIASAKEEGQGLALLRFLEIWTKKEAYLKYTGSGIFEDMRSFSVLNTDSGVKYMQYEKNGLMIAVCAETGCDLTCDVIHIL